MTDLKLIDELLTDLATRQGLTLAELERHSYLTREAMHRLRTAWVSGEMPEITLSLAKYFDQDACSRYR